MCMWVTRAHRWTAAVIINVQNNHWDSYKWPRSKSKKTASALRTQGHVQMCRFVPHTVIASPSLSTIPPPFPFSMQILSFLQFPCIARVLSILPFSPFCVIRGEVWNTHKDADYVVDFLQGNKIMEIPLPTKLKLWVPTIFI